MPIVEELCSEVPVYSNEITWHVKDFMCWPLKEDGEHIIESEWFTTFKNGDKQAACFPEVLWQLRLYPHGIRHCTNNECIVLGLASTNAADAINNVSYKAEVTYGDPQRTVINEFSGDSIRWDGTWQQLNFGIVIKRSEVEDPWSQHLNGFNDLVTSFKIKHPGPPTAMDNNQISVPRNNLDHKLLSMYKEQSLTDTTIKTSDGDEIGVHKLVLMANSVVLKKMLTSDYVEGSSDIINMSDISKEVCDIMMRFMYGVNDLPEDLTDETIEQLLHCAEKYGLDGLKIRCEKRLSDKLTCENVVHLLLVGDMYRAEQLMLQCHHYINRNKREVTASGTFKTAMLNHP